MSGFQGYEKITEDACLNQSGDCSIPYVSITSLMNSVLFCHCLIGLPGAGKTTLANEWVKENDTLEIICPDDIRDQLYGDPVIQGDWQAVQKRIKTQFKAAIDQGQSIIYDATNIRRAWRTDLLKSVANENLRWIGWQLLTPVKTCLERNQGRDRQVPIDVIIDFAQILNQEPPSTSEGFDAIYDIPLNDNQQVNWDEMRSLQDSL